MFPLKLTWKMKKKFSAFNVKYLILSYKIKIGIHIFGNFILTRFFSFLWVTWKGVKISVMQFPERKEVDGNFSSFISPELILPRVVFLVSKISSSHIFSFCETIYFLSVLTYPANIKVCRRTIQGNHYENNEQEGYCISKIKERQCW